MLLLSAILASLDTDLSFSNDMYAKNRPVLSMHAIAVACNCMSLEKKMLFVGFIQTFKTPVHPMQHSKQCEKQDIYRKEHAWHQGSPGD